MASQYFCTILTTEKTKGNSVWPHGYETRKLDNAPVYGIQGGMGLPGFTVKPQETHTSLYHLRRSRGISCNCARFRKTAARTPS